MLLTAGARLGPYEIVGPLGAGGMGEVYRAKDSRLGREVAIKVLPQHLSANPEVRARFEREAKTVSSLNHPNICTLFDVGRAPGVAGSAETDYLVMELVDGETLSARIARGALPAADVLRIGAQVADALDRAHRAGVVHRDLKPGNVMLTRSGAKLMDFGLARATGLAGPAGGSGITHAALTQSPTVAAPLTAEGTIVGTFQYMSPEQLEGKESDARADLWALGCVLYEMATGRRAFDGQSQASLIAAIMHVTPAPVSQVATMAPPALDRVVSACLAKDPADRIQSAHDVKLQLGWIAEPGSNSSIGATPALPATRAKDGALVARLSLLVGLLGLLAAGFAGWSLLSHRESLLVAEVPTPKDLQIYDYWSGSAISPDGTMLVDCAQRRGEKPRLWLWRLDSADPVALQAEGQANFPSWSPDGRSIAYCSWDEKAIFRVSASGGAPTRLSVITDCRGLSWGGKDVIVYAPAAAGPLMKIPAAGGTPEPATVLDAARHEASHRFPSFLPDGEHFFFAVIPPGPRGFTIRVGSLGSKESKVVMEAESSVMYAAPGYVIFVQNHKITAQRFDLGKLEAVGQKFTLDDAPIVSDMDAEPVATASRNGRLLYLVSHAPDTRLEWLDRSGTPRGTVAVPEGDWTAHAVSPDSRFALATRGGDLWQVDLARSVATRVLRGVDPLEPARWSPDGKRFAATSRETGSEKIRIYNSGGGAAIDSIPAIHALFQEVRGWSSDGSSLLVAGLGGTGTESGQATSWDLYTVPLDGGAAKPWIATPAFERQAGLSPDGHWAFCVSRAEGQLELFIDSYPVPGHRVQVFNGEPDRPMPVGWGRGGHELLYTDADGYLVSLPLERVGDELHPGTPVRLFAVPGGTEYLQSLDGERFLLTRANEAAPGPSLRLVLGWTGLLKK